MDDGNASTSNEQEKPNKNDEQDNSNPFETEIDRVETDKAEETKTGLLNKAPVFEFAGVSEEIDDLSKTFEDIRISKAEDFPELEDGKRVSWKMSYCGIVKNIEQPKKTTIAEQKKIIEESKDFMNAIKRKKVILYARLFQRLQHRKRVEWNHTKVYSLTKIPQQKAARLLRMFRVKMETYMKYAIIPSAHFEPKQKE